MDVNGNDLSFVAIVKDGILEGYDVLVGGGMGCTHNTPGTYPQIAKNIGFIESDQICQIAEAVVTTQRDNGDRTDRKKARLKYTVDRMGVDAFKSEVETRSGIKLASPEPYEFTMHADMAGQKIIMEHLI